jgi:excisionase family DNA binding protein
MALAADCRFLTQKEAAAFLRVSLQTLLRLEKRFDLQKIKLGRSARYPVQALEQFALSQRVRVATPKLEP